MTEPTTPGASATNPLGTSGAGQPGAKSRSLFVDTDDWISRVTEATNRGDLTLAYSLYGAGLTEFCTDGKALTWRQEVERRLCVLNLRADQCKPEANKRAYQSLLDAVSGEPPAEHTAGGIPLGVEHIAHIHRCFAVVMAYQGCREEAIDHAQTAMDLFAQAGVGDDEFRSPHDEFRVHAANVLVETMLEDPEITNEGIQEALRILQKATAPISAHYTSGARGRHVLAVFLLADLFRRSNQKAKARQATQYGFRLLSHVPAPPPYYFPSRTMILLARLWPRRAYKIFGRHHARRPEF